MRALAIDFGSKRIGVAVGVDEPLATSDRPSLAPTGALARDAVHIAELARAEEVDVVVIGVPENDQDPRMSRICRRLAEAVRALGLDVREVDESWTSVEAEAHLRASGLKAAARQRVRDGEAARLILERFFAAT